MIVDLSQEEITTTLLLLEYLDYLGYAPTDEDSLLIESVIAKLDDA